MQSAMPCHRTQQGTRPVHAELREEGASQCCGQEVRCGTTGSERWRTLSWRGCRGSAGVGAGGQRIQKRADATGAKLLAHAIFNVTHHQEGLQATYGVCGQMLFVCFLNRGADGRGHGDSGCGSGGIAACQEGLNRRLSWAHSLVYRLHELRPPAQKAALDDHATEVGRVLARTEPAIEGEILSTLVKLSASDTIHAPNRSKSLRVPSQTANEPYQIHSCAQR